MILISHSQMTTIYEFGSNTNDTIPIYKTCSQHEMTTVSGCDSTFVGSYNSLISSNWTIKYTCLGVDSKSRKWLILPLMSLYTDLEFIIDFTTYSQNNNSYNLELFSSNSDDCSTIFSNLQSSNNIDTNINSLQTIEYSNTNGDSILSLEIPLKFLNDSLFVNINYIKISADISTLNTKNRVEFIESNIYPNPTKNLLNIELSNPNKLNYELAIYDNLGRRIYFSNIIIDDKIEIDLKNFKNGIYHYTIFNPAHNIRSNGKFIKS